MRTPRSQQRRRVRHVFEGCERTYNVWHSKNVHSVLQHGAEVHVGAHDELRVERRTEAAQSGVAGMRTPALAARRFA